MWYDREDLSEVAPKYNGDASKILLSIRAYVLACSIESFSTESVLHGHFIPNYELGPGNEFPQVGILCNRASAAFMDVEGDFETGVGSASAR